MDSKTPERRESPARASESKPDVGHGPASLLERRRSDQKRAEAELEAALRTCSKADAAARDVERVLRKVWDAATADGGANGEHLDRIAEIRAKRAAVMQQKLHAHHAADLAAKRLGAARLGVEAAEAIAKRLRAHLAQHATAVAALCRGVALAERQLASRRKALDGEEAALNRLQRQLLDGGYGVSLGQGKSVVSY